MKFTLVYQKGLVVTVLTALLLEGVTIVALSYRRVHSTQQSYRSTTEVSAFRPSATPLPMNKEAFLAYILPTITPTSTLPLTPVPSSTPSPLHKPIPTVTTIPTPTPTRTPVTGRPPDGYSRLLLATDKGNFSIQVISLPRTVSMWTVSGNDTDCNDNCIVKSLGSYALDLTGIAAINGTYFCPTDYTECASKRNSYDFPIFNSTSDSWINGGNLYWSDRAIIWQDTDGFHFDKDARQQWRLKYDKSRVESLQAAIVNAPGLLDDGTVIVDRYPLTDKQTAKGVKAGIGASTERIYLVVAQNATVTDLAYIFKSLNAVFALNLDGGGSAALWYNGYKVGPGRNLPNAVVFTSP